MSVDPVWSGSWRLAPAPRGGIYRPGILGVVALVEGQVRFAFGQLLVKLEERPQKDHDRRPIKDDMVDDQQQTVRAIAKMYQQSAQERPTAQVERLARLLLHELSRSVLPQLTPRVALKPSVEHQASHRADILDWVA